MFGGKYKYMDNKSVMEKYYKFRKEIQKLYKNDVYNTGDLCSKILGIRDKEKCIESIRIDLDSYTINIELSQDTTDKKKSEIVEKIARSIGYYIVDNRDKIDPEINEDESFETYITSANHLYCDIIIIGKSVTFIL